MRGSNHAHRPRSARIRPSAHAYTRVYQGSRGGGAEVTARVCGLTAASALRRPRPELASGGEVEVLLGALPQVSGPVSGYSRAMTHAPLGVCSNSVKCPTRNSADRSASPL